MTISVPTKPNPSPTAYSLDLIALLQAAACSASGDGPMGKALNVIRTALDRDAKYIDRRHACKVGGHVISVPDMVNIANHVLDRAGLSTLLIAYPGSHCSLVEHCCAVNDNAQFPRFQPVPRPHGDQRGGV